jgi:plastocyanin
MRGRRTGRPRAAAAWALVGALLGAGSASAATHTISIEGMRFEPQSIVVSPGDQVVWVNRDPFPHTVVSVAGGLRSPEIAAGRSWRRTLSRRGKLAYGCSLHPTMTGTLQVR